MLENFISLPDPDGPASGEALCRRCASECGGCCRTELELAHLSFPLSIPEWRRTAPYSRLATSSSLDDREAFAWEEARVNSEPLPPGDFPMPPPGGDKVCAEEENRPDFIASMHSLFKGRKKRINELFPSEGTHMAMRIRADGSCVFLGSSGCRLPRSARPWYCLLFPAWVMGETLILFSSPDCLISRKARGPVHGIALLRSDPATVRELHARLREDWGLD